MYLGSKNVGKVERRKSRQQEHSRLKKQYYKSVSEEMKFILFG